MFLSLLLLLIQPVRGGVVPDGLGVCAHYKDLTPDQTKAMFQVGFRWVRTDLPWAEIEHHKGSYDFARYDSIARNIRDAGLRPLFILDYGNDLYGGTPPRSDEAVAAFARYAVESARHFREYHPSWEIYNEPNGRTFWQPAANSSEYARLALATAKAIKEAVPDAPIVAFSLTRIDIPFLKAGMDAGLLSYIDEVSVHMYRFYRPESAIEDYRALKDLIASYHPNHRVGVLCTEWGYPLTYQGVTEERQAAYDARCYLVGLVAGIDGTALYEWNDTPQAAGETQGHFGLHGSSGEPRGGLNYLHDLTEGLSGYHFETYDHSDEDSYTLHFRKGDEERLVAWTAAGDPRDSAGFQQNPKGDPHKRSTGHVAGRDVELSAAPRVVRR